MENSFIYFLFIYFIGLLIFGFFLKKIWDYFFYNDLFTSPDNYVSYYDNWQKGFYKDEKNLVDKRQDKVESIGKTLEMKCESKEEYYIVKFGYLPFNCKFRYSKSWWSKKDHIYGTKQGDCQIDICFENKRFVAVKALNYRHLKEVKFSSIFI